MRRHCSLRATPPPSAPSPEPAASGARTPAERRRFDPDEIVRRHRARAVVAEDGELDLLPGRGVVRDDDAVRGVEAADHRAADLAEDVRHVSIDPDLGVVVDHDFEHDGGAGGVAVLRRRLGGRGDRARRAQRQRLLVRHLRTNRGRDAAAQQCDSQDAGRASTHDVSFLCEPLGPQVPRRAGCFASGA